MSGELVRGMSDSAADTVFGSGATDEDLEFLVWRIEQGLKSLGVKDARIFAAEFCGDEIPSVMDGRAQPTPDFTFAVPVWSEL